MTTKSKMQWMYYINQCNYCLECVDTCNCLTLTNLKRIVRDQDCCTRCETCSIICPHGAIVTEIIY